MDYQFGFYGKLPITGDFIQRNLPDHFVYLWDNWLQESFVVSRDKLQDNWLPNYLSSPIWRFLIGPSIIDRNAYVGILAPSVDSVGRYFPMTIAMPLPPQLLSGLFSQTFQQVFEQLESLFFKYLHIEVANTEAFNKELQQQNQLIKNLLAHQTVDNLPDSLDGHRFAINANTTIGTTISALWISSLLDKHPEVSLWWSQGCEAIDPSLLISNGLPSQEQYTSMLCGNWAAYQWRPANLSLAGETTKNATQAEISNNNDAPVTSDPAPQTNKSLPENSNAGSPLTSQSITEESLLSEISTSPLDNLQLSGGNDLTFAANNAQSEQLYESATPNTNQRETITVNSTKSAPATDSLQDDTFGGATLLDSFELTDLQGLDHCLKASSFSFSHIGHRRQINQDSILDDHHRSLWVVADGMGGHTAGEKASRAIVDCLSAATFHGDLFDNVNQTQNALQNVNHQLFSTAVSQNITCGSTVVAFIQNENQCAYLWAGDSRLYRLRNGHLQQMTTDHSATPPSSGDLLESSKRKSHAITRAIGVADTLQLESAFNHLEAGDHFLLCSDGVYDCLSPDQILTALSLASAEEAGEFLQKNVLSGDAPDNLSGVLMWY